MREEAADVACKISLAPDDFVWDLDLEMEAGRWTISQKTQEFLGSRWKSSTIGWEDIACSYLWNGKGENALSLTVDQGMLAYVSAKRTVREESCYIRDMMQARMYGFWEGKGNQASLSISFSLSPQQRFHLSHSCFLDVGVFRFSHQLDGMNHEQDHGIAMQAKGRHVSASISYSIQQGKPPRFGGESQKIVREMVSELKYRSQGLTVDGTLEQKLKIAGQDVGDTNTRYTLKATLQEYGFSVSWDTKKGYALKLESKQGYIILQESGIRCMVQLEKLPLSISVLLKEKQPCLITYTLSFTSDPHSGSPPAR
ncbi:MAG: hypothetical protein AB7D92_03050 [Sphaerochaeta sp.]